LPSLLYLLLLFAVSCNQNSFDNKIEDLGVKLAEAKAKRICKQKTASIEKCQEFTNEIIRDSKAVRDKMIADANNKCVAKNSSNDDCETLKKAIITDLEKQIKDEIEKSNL
jgi:hypothetical protein